MNTQGFLQLRSRDDLRDLVANQVQENLHLDYKRCEALAKKDPRKKEEVSKDVSSFANSDGGQIIYGIVEKNKLPEKLDTGFDPNDISREWLDQVINSGIRPRIAGLEIVPIPLTKRKGAKVIYVVNVPQSSNGPHQASDKRYYRRLNFVTQIMNDYEIRDIANRRLISIPKLVVDTISVEHVFYLMIKNLGQIPAEHIRLTSSSDLKISDKTRLSDTHIFKHGIRYLGCEKSYYLPLGVTHQMIAEVDVPIRFQLQYSYSGHQRGEDEFEIDLREFSGTTPEPSIAGSRLKKIESHLKEYVKYQEKLVRHLGEIHESLSSRGVRIAQATLWEAARRLNDEETKFNLRSLSLEDMIIVFDLSPSQANVLYLRILGLGAQQPTKDDLLEIGLGEEQADRVLSRSFWPYPD